MSRLAHVGSKPDEPAPANVVDFIFSNPFSQGSPVLDKASPTAARGHHIPLVRTEKPLYSDSTTGESLSWQKTHRDALAIAAGLQSLRLSDDHVPSPECSPVVLLYLPNCLAFPPVLFGVLAAGLTATMANPNLTSVELAYILKNARPCVIITTVDGYPKLESALSTLDPGAAKQARIFLTSSTHYMRPTPPRPGAQSLHLLLASSPLHNAVFMTGPAYTDRAAVILWSSGTSGMSKGVLLTHRALVNTVIALWHINPNFDADQRWLGFAPFFHVFGLCYIVLLSACCGATVHTMPAFNAEQMLALVQRHKITFLHCAPPVLLVLAKSELVDKYDLGSLRGVVSGGAPAGRELIQAVHARLNVMVKMGYGLSEACSVCNQTGDTFEELDAQLGSTGVPLHGVELRIVSTDGEKRTLKINEEGEILIRSPSLMLGYLNNPAATAEALDSTGWFHTGDVGRLDDRGCLTITDRLKEVIKVKGFQVSPSDVEASLLALPAIADAGVTSVYHAGQASEFPRAYVVPRNPALVTLCTSSGGVAPQLAALAQEIKKHTEGRMTQYKWLVGGLVFVPQIPKAPTGKILRRLLRDVEGVEVVLYQQKMHGTVATARL